VPAVGVAPPVAEAPGVGEPGAAVLQARAKTVTITTNAHQFLFPIR
jgi:hypothetical protein